MHHTRPPHNRRTARPENTRSERERRKWAGKNVGLIENYINPILGEYYVQDVSRRVVDGFIPKLQKTPPVSTPYRKARTETLPPCTIEKICKVMHCAFRQAVRWDMVPKNPFDDVLLPKKEKKVRTYGQWK